MDAIEIFWRFGLKLLSYWWPVLLVPVGIWIHDHFVVKQKEDKQHA